MSVDSEIEKELFDIIYNRKETVFEDVETILRREFDQKIDNLRNEFDQKLENTEKRIMRKLNDVEIKLEQRIITLEQKFYRFQQDILTAITQLSTQIATLNGNTNSNSNSNTKTKPGDPYNACVLV
jgi:hypothetical protein